MLDALAALQRAASLAAAQQALPTLLHLPELLGLLLAAAPDDTRTAWQTRLSQVDVHLPRVTTETFRQVV